MFEAERKEMMERVLIIKAGDKNRIGECPLSGAGEANISVPDRYIRLHKL